MLITGTPPLSGTSGPDVIVVTDGGTQALAGGGGSDIILDDFGGLNTASGNSFATAVDIGSLDSLWYDAAIRDNPLVGDAAIPHIASYVFAAQGTQRYLKLVVPAGRTLTVDIDAAIGAFGTGVSVDTTVTLYRQDGGHFVEVAAADDSTVGQGGEGSVSLDSAGIVSHDAYLSHANTEAGAATFVIEIGQFNAPAFIVDSAFLLFVSLDGHAVGGTVTAASGNLIEGGAGDDLIVGGAGNDTLLTGPGKDAAFGGDGDDTITPLVTGGNPFADLLRADGGDGDDHIASGIGSDILSGGAGFDTLSYALSPAPVTLDLDNGTASGGYAAGDTLDGFEKLIGSAFADRLTAGAGIRALDGGGGDDTLYLTGDALPDTIDGGPGSDMLDSSASTLSGVTFDFAAGVWIHAGRTGTLSRIEQFVDGGGSSVIHAPTGLSRIVTGSGDDTVFEDLAGTLAFVDFGPGDDRLVLRNPDIGGDSFDGGADEDTIDLSALTLPAGAGVSIDLAAGVIERTGPAAPGGGPQRSDLLRFEHAIGLATGEMLAGTSGANRLEGRGGDDHLIGREGDDVLAGGIGADLLVGGKGDDIYEIDDTGDAIVEAAGEGIDTVRSSIGFALRDHGQHLENLTLTGTANIAATGNGLANTITGNSGNNLINGGSGDDILSGGAGNDSFFDDSGADRMSGGTGDDLYKVDDPGDRVIERAGEGTDTVRASIPVALRDFGQAVENLVLIGADNIAGTGNGLANTITGNSGDNLINGGSGDDVLSGGDGNDTFFDDAGGDMMTGGRGHDTYVVDDPGDRIVEAASSGFDVVFASISFALRDHGQALENLTLLGSAPISGTGNGLNNTITGNSGDNVLNGGSGSDTLIGGGGNDTFVDDRGSDRFTGGGGADTFRFFGNFGQDTITDFQRLLPGEVIDLRLVAPIAGFADLVAHHAAQIGADTVIDDGRGNSITLLNIALSGLTPANFLF